MLAPAPAALGARNYTCKMLASLILLNIMIIQRRISQKKGKSIQNLYLK